MLKKVLITSLSTFLLFSCQSDYSKSARRGLSSVEPNREIFSVGEVKTSIFSPEEFRSIHGPAWVLMDGGKDYLQLKGKYRDLSTNELLGHSIPDARGKFLRMHNNGANCKDKGQCQFDVDSRRSLGSYQNDAFQGHKHFESTFLPLRWVGGKRADGVGDGKSFTREQPTAGTYELEHGVPRVATETRPKNIAVNFYIKVVSCHAFDESEVCK